MILKTHLSANIVYGFKDAFINDIYFDRKSKNINISTILQKGRKRPLFILIKI